MSLINIQGRKCLGVGGGGRRMWFFSRTGSDSNHTSLLDSRLSGGMPPRWCLEGGVRAESVVRSSNCGPEKLLTALIMCVLPAPEAAGAETCTVGGVVGAGRRGHPDTFSPPHSWRASVLYFLPCCMTSK